MRYPVVLFDLFRTVVLYREGTATNQVHQADWRAAMLRLAPRFLAAAPGLEVEAFLDALVTATDQIASERGSEMREIAIEARYARALASLGISDDGTAARLAAVQVDAQMEGTTVPAGHHSLLASLARNRKLALVSNFDHAGSLHSMLARHQLERYFSTVVISIEQGRRKPHPEIFRAALDALGASADEALHVGDSFGPDVKGAQAAGIDVAWINPSHKPVPQGAEPPTYEIATLTDIAEIIDPDAEANP